MGLLRLTSLRSSGKWNRSQPETEHGRAMYRLEKERDAEKLAERKALQFGAEYGQHYLRDLVWKATGCDLCGRFHPPAVLHHVKSRARHGQAEDLVVLGQRCHDLGHAKGWSELETRYGKDLVAVAAQHAAEGLAAEYLPVERCDICYAWHSRKFMLNLIQPNDNEPVQRICVWCAPPGPI